MEVTLWNGLLDGDGNRMSCGSSNIVIDKGWHSTGNVPLLLHEIRHALERLLHQGKETTIDLRSLPLGPGEEELLEQALGSGELSARLEALGPSIIQETAFAGVWLVTHYNEHNEIIGKLIEITLTPSLLNSQKEDVEDGLQRLTSRLEDDS